MGTDMCHQSLPVECSGRPHGARLTLLDDIPDRALMAGSVAQRLQHPVVLLRQQWTAAAPRCTV
jgi:hypothetical protein